MANTSFDIGVGCCELSWDRGQKASGRSDKEPCAQGVFGALERPGDYCLVDAQGVGGAAQTAFAIYRQQDALVDTPKVGFFPGSTIGNLKPEAAVALLARARNWSGAKHFILGVDLVNDPTILLGAYDDSQGVTAKFTRNILKRMNEELGGDFDLNSFRYNVALEQELSRIEMSLVSTYEPIHANASRNYKADSLLALVGACGWQVRDLLKDSEHRFAVAVLETMESDAIN